MFETCTFPLCPRIAERNGLCFLHAKWYGSVKPQKEVKAIPKRSEKMQDAIKEVKELYAIFLAKPENQSCIIGAKGCTIKATVVHHSRGREGKQLSNVKDWMPACPSCNGYVEANDGWARRNGFKKAKHTK
jgi:hypothetical protein